MKTFTITALLALFCSFPPVQAQQTGEIGGEALQMLSRTDNGKYDRYITEYKRMYAMYTADGTFADYLTDGKKYTVIVPDNTGIEVYYRTEGSANGNPPRLCNTLKYNIVKGKFVPEAFKDGQTLYTLFSEPSADRNGQKRQGISYRQAGKPGSSGQILRIG
jgi:hypothetical protein